MARPKKDATVDLTVAHDLYPGLIERARCPDGVRQAFLRDTGAPGLRVRLTAGGAKSYVFEAKIAGRTFRRTIGDVGSWAIDAARTEARKLAVLVDQGTDPRQLDAERAEEAAKAAAEAASRELTFGAAWTRYVTARTPFWSERHVEDHERMVKAGGVPRKRRPGVLTKPGPLHSLLNMRLVDLDGAKLEEWAKGHVDERAARVRLALRLLSAFFHWAAEESDLASLVAPTALRPKKARERAGRAATRDDVLLREQLRPWFAAVRTINNEVISAYLQTLLLIGARPGEVLSLRWDDIDSKWNTMTIRDKVDGERVIPLTPYVWELLRNLPRRNENVFSAARVVSLEPRLIARRGRWHAAHGRDAPSGAVIQSSESGRLVDPSIAHRKACAAAGLAGLTLHGLRRSFSTLSEWLEVPVGVVAQIQGHKPSATAEKHYKRRPVDLLRVHHTRIEAWMLEQAGIEFSAQADAQVPPLRIVGASQ